MSNHPHLNTDLPCIPQDDIVGALLEASHFAAIKHRSQRRKDKDATPYINHPLGIAWSLYKEGGVKDVATLQAAILHDTVEDTETTPEELTKIFGKEVSQIVMECTDDKSLPKAERKRLQEVNAPHKSTKAKVVKLGDKLYNLRDLQRSIPLNWTRERAQEYFAWAKRVTDSIKGTNKGLEDALEDIYQNGTFTFEGKTYRCIPKA